MTVRPLMLLVLVGAPLLALEVTPLPRPVPPSPEASGGPWERHATLLWSLHPPVVRSAPAMTSGVTITALSASATSVNAYQRIEFQVSLDQVIALPYECDPTQGGLDLQATFTAPSGAVWQVPGFFDGTMWKVRFCPNEISATPWQVLVGARSSASSSNLGGSFLCQGLPAGAARHGWGRIQSTGLQFSQDGSWFWGLGHNTGWQSNVETPTAAVMAAHGENLLSFWMAEPWELQVSDGNPAHDVLPERAPLETTNVGLGVYNQDACAYLDGVVADAEAAGVYLLPTLWAHDEAQDPSAPFGNGSWSNNAYSLICATPADFFTIDDGTGQPTASWHYQLNRYRYIAARWGCSTAIIGWVGMDEIDGTVGASLPQSQSWCLGVRQALSQWDPYRTAANGTYPLVVTKTDTTSRDAATWGGFLDLSACDSYVSDASTAAIAGTISSETASMLTQGKPCFNGEFGAALTSGDAATVSQPDHLRHGVMAGLAAGACCSPLLWTDGGQFPLVGDGSPMGGALLSQYQAIGAFSASLGILGDPTLQPMASICSVTSIHCSGRMDVGGDAGFLWLSAAQSLSTFIHPKLTVSSVAAGTFTVSWFDVVTGTALSPQSVATTPVATGLSTTSNLILDIPASSEEDLALSITLQVASSSSTSTSTTSAGGTGTGSATSASTSGSGSGTAATSGASSATTTGAGSGSGTGGTSGSSSSSGSRCGLGLGGVSLLLAITWRHRRTRRASRA